MSDEPDVTDADAAGPESLAYWCQETLNNPNSAAARAAAEMVHGKPEPEKLLRAAADLWVDQPRGLAAYGFEELVYVALVVAAQAHGVDPNGMAEHVRDHVEDYFESEEDAAKMVLHMCQRWGHDPGYPDPPTVADPHRLTAEDIHAIRSYAQKRPPGIELIGAANGYWYIYTG